MHKLLSLYLCILLTGCSHFPLGHVGQTADSATTAVAIFGYSASESNPVLSPLMSNPIGHIALFTGKMILGYGIIWGLSGEACRVSYQAYSGLGWGAAIHNLAVMTGLASPPLTPVIFAMASVYAAIITDTEKLCLP